MKFGRKAQLSIEVNPGTDGQGQDNVVIDASQFTIEFEIDRQSLSESATANFRILNLGEKTRNLIQRDPWANSEYRLVQFRAGYGDALPICFLGHIRSALSYRDQVNFVTEVCCLSGGLEMANSFTAQTVAANTTSDDLLKSLCLGMKNLSGQPIIGSFPQKNLRGKVLMGNTWNIIIEESGGLAVIDNNQVKILNDNECVKAEIPLIDADTGLLGSPRRTETSIEFDILFESSLTVGQIVQLQSSTNKLYNGTYKVMGFNHRGTISPVVSGTCVSHVLLWLGKSGLTVIDGAVVQ